MKLPVLFAVPAIIFSTAATMPAQSPVAASAPYQVNQKTEAPGATLTPGSYTIRIADHLNDRLIVQVQRNGSQNITTLLAYPNSALSNGSNGPVLFSSGLKSKPTLRGFVFAGGPAVEFVYPKQDAVTLAKANDVKVMAVDPASEGRPKLPQLTQSDMNEVTLWMLTPTAVQPGGSPGIQAARYQPSSTTAPTEVAANTPPPPPPPSSYRATPPPAPSEAPAPPPPPAPRQHIRPAVKQLPHTASNLPLIALAGLLSLGVGGSLTLNRKVRS